MRLKTRRQVKQERNDRLWRSLSEHELEGFAVDHVAVEPNRIRIFLREGEDLREVRDVMWPERDGWLPTFSYPGGLAVFGTVDGVAVDLIGATE